MQLRIATRKSELALWQAHHVADRLSELPEVDSVELVPMTTRGDDIVDRSLQKIGGKGLFIKELEFAMQEGVADLAVHSMKDVPAEMPDGFCIAAVLPRANPSDALVSASGGGLPSISHGARVGSSSLRRQAQLRALRPDLDVQPLRGNVNTRIAKLERGDFEAIVLATAGLQRLNMADRIAQEFKPEEMLPAAAQGVVGIECLAGRSRLLAVLAQLQDDAANATTTAERAVARTLNASCHSPLGSFATLDGENLNLRALVASVDGGTLLRETASGPSADAEGIGEAVALQLLERGAGELLEP